MAQYNQIHCEAQEAMKEWQPIGNLQYAQKNTNNNSKVIFILSYMDDGEAEKWKQYYINNEVVTAGFYIWPKVANFFTKVKEAFAFEDEKEDSVRKLETLRQGNWNTKEMTNKFQLLVAKAGLDKDNLIRECHGLPWGFPGQPAPIPVKTHTRIHGCGFWQVQVYFSVPQAILVESMGYMESKD